MKKVWGGGNPLGAGGSSGSSSVCLGPTLCLLPSLAPPALPVYAGTRLEDWSFSGQQRWLWYGLLRGRPSSHLSIPHPAKLGPSESHTHSVPPHPGPLVPGQPLQQPPWAWSGHWGTPGQWPLVCTAAAFLATATENPLGPAATTLGPPGCPSLSHDRSSQRDQSPRPCLPFTSPGSLFLMPTALQPLALCLAPETSWRAPKRKEAGPGAPVPGRVCWGPGCCGGASGCGCQVGSVVQGCCSCWAFVLLNGGAGVSLGLQAPVRGVEEEHQEAAEEDAEAGHQQHGHWGDTAQLCLRRPKRLGTHPGAGDPRATSGIDPRPAPRGRFSEPGAVSPKVTPPGLRTWVCNTIPLLSLAFCLHLCVSLRLLLCLSCL